MSELDERRSAGRRPARGDAARAGSGAPPVPDAVGDRDVPGVPAPAEGDESAERIQRAVVALLRWASRSTVRSRLWAGEGVDLTATDTWLVEALAAHGPMRLTSLAAWQGVDKSTVTPQVRRLERAGLVERAPDPQDGRASLLSLSERGRDVLEMVRSSGGRLLVQPLESWSAEDRRAFAELLTRFARGLEDGNGEHARTR
ncbi:MarR family winged helix-turn-helix transcriptional regulator [Georgenia sp. AZ-5]|uniref:MarR family winged helix-turn-helix transcriptional regulator n=1 Tax=Georgenia sp. AZ-5 TaxID=3367526 RepID=UPI003754C609